MSFYDGICQSPMCLRLGISVSDEACWSLLCLKSDMVVSNGACQSRMKQIEIFDGSVIRHVGIPWGMSVSNEARRGLRSDMLVLDGSPIGL